jgi:hypothetical protein
MGAQGYTLEQIAKFRRIAAGGDSHQVGVVKHHAGHYHGKLLELF